MAHVGHQRGFSVVLLANPADRATALAALCRGPGRRLCATDDAYAAAVEMLTADRCVLVVDSATLRPEQEGLLALAAGEGVPCVAIAPGKRPGRPIDGVRAVDPADLPDTLAELAASEEAEAPTDPPESAPERSPESRPAPSPLAPPEAPSRPDARPGDLDLLTPQEVSALLEPPS